MDLSIFFNPIEEFQASALPEAQTVYQHIKVHHEQLPDWRQADIALIGLCEERGAPDNQGSAQGAAAIRAQLYGLQKGTGAYRIVDLGDLRNGIRLEDTYARIKEVCEHLLDHQTIPVLLGGSHDLMLGQFYAYQHLDRIISIANIDARLDVEDSERRGMHHHHLLKILTHQPNYLFNFNQLGHQAYLNSSTAVEIFERLYFNLHSVGKIREDINEIEPNIREADMLSIDLSALRMDDAPANLLAEPFGLSAEELCQICWFAGLSEHNSSLGFFELNPSADIRHKTARITAIALWYYIEGFYHRHGQLDFQQGHFQKYLVSLDGLPASSTHTLTFYKHLSSEKWWMEVAYPLVEQPLPPCIVPCSYQDYLRAVEGEVPTRWLNTHAKLL